MGYSGTNPDSAWALPSSYTAATVARDAGLDPALDLVQACSDFYWLERAEADGMPGAADKMAECESYIAEQFAIYLDMACGGELRLLPVQSSGPYSDNDDYCAGRWCGNGDACYSCGGFYCFNCYMCHNLQCRANKVGFASSSYFESAAVLFKCLKSYGTPDPHSCGCEDNSGPKYGEWEQDVHPALIAYFDKMDYSGSIERHEGWQSWLDFRQAHGLDALRWMVEAFNHAYWTHSCGGPKWGEAAKLLLDYLEGTISPRVMVNMAWSMEHNGGCIFNKVFAVEGDGYNGRPSLHRILEQQASDNYTYLEGFLSKPIKKFALYVKMMTKTKQGQRYMQETKLYNIVKKSMDESLPVNKRSHFGSVAHVVAENVHLSE